MTAISNVTVVNGGLRILGVARIASFSEDSPAAKLANEHFDNIRDFVLRAHPWSFATERAVLAALSGAPLFGFEFNYQVPADNLRILEDEDSSLTPGSIWKIEGKKILTDLGPPLNVVYVKRVTDPTQFDLNFVNALEARIGEEFGEALTGTNSLVEKANAIYTRNLREARTINGQESSPQFTQASEWIRARFGQRSGLRTRM